MARRLSNYLMLAAAAAARCEVLRSLDFQQHTAPKGVSELLGPVVSLVSEKAEVGDIKIRWDGELGLHRVGTHKIVAENSDGACLRATVNERRRTFFFTFIFQRAATSGRKLPSVLQLFKIRLKQNFAVAH